MSFLSEREILPNNRIPIAEDGCGNYFLLSVESNDKEAMFYLERELEEQFRFADSLVEFLDGLTFHPEDPTQTQ